MAMAPYQAVNIIFNKDERFHFGSKKQHAVNNMLFFETAVAMENRVLKLPKSLQDQPHKWDYDSMLRSSKAADERRKMDRGMTARRDHAVQQRLDALHALLANEQRRRAATAPYYQELLDLFDGVKVGSVMDDFEPIPLSSEAQARRAAIAARAQNRDERPSIRQLMTRAAGEAAAAAQSREEGGGTRRESSLMSLNALKTQIMRARGLQAPKKGVMGQTASRGLDP
jgi:hypothetical protein